MPTNTRIVNFFNPADPFASVHPANWEVQSCSPSISNQRAQGLAANGDEAAYQIYGGQESCTVEYKVLDGTGISLAAFAPGAVDPTTGYHCDGVTVNYTGTDYPSISVSCHKHTHCEDGVTSHGSPHRVAQVSFMGGNLPYGFGIPVSLRKAVGVTGDLSVGVTSLSYQTGITHQDEAGATGGYLASDNRDGTETISLGLTGVLSADPTPGEGWTMTEKSTPTGNTAAETSTYTFEKHVPCAVPTAGG